MKMFDIKPRSNFSDAEKLLYDILQELKKMNEDKKVKEIVK